MKQTFVYVGLDVDDTQYHGSAWVEAGGCGERVIRGGSWSDKPEDVRTSDRYGGSAGLRGSTIGFRLAQDAP